MKFVLLIGASLASLPAIAQEPSDLQRLRNSYDGAVQRAVRPISEAYLKDLNRLRDTYTRGARLAEAVQVDEEIKLMNAKLAGMGVAVQGTAGQRTVVLDSKVKVPANDPNGYRLGAVRQGDVITLQYVEGMWKGHGHIATENPDVTKDDESRLVIARGADKEKPGAVIAVVPSETAKKPFAFTVPTTRDDVVLRIHKNSENKKNPGSVTYQVKVTR